MKLVLAIINNDDSVKASAALTTAGFSVTKLSTTGGFLMVGNVTLLIGTDDEKVDAALNIIRKHCAKRMEPMPAVVNAGVPAFGYYKAEILVGGATVFVTPVERFEKM